jgi:ribosome biogenesis GTPase
VTRLWRDGIFDEESPDKVRWSREAKKPAPKIKKKMALLPGNSTGMVIEVNRKTCRVLSLQEKEYTCTLSPNLDLSAFKSIAAGDKVIYSLNDGKSGLIREIYPRKNQLSRCGPEDRKHSELVLAVNIDWVIIVFSFKNTLFNGAMLDRFLAKTIEMGFEPVICINKYDLKSNIPEELPYLKKLGYRLIFCSVKTGQGMQELGDLIRGKKSVLTGPSGVGKSSIIKFFNPSLPVKIGAVRESDGKGRHVTNRSNFYAVDDQTWIVDTPGLRVMAIWNKPVREVDKYFKEIRTLSSKCLFRNCRHISENGCEVRRAVKVQRIPLFRYKSYLKMVASVS